MKLALALSLLFSLTANAASSTPALLCKGSDPEMGEYGEGRFEIRVSLAAQMNSFGYAELINCASGDASPLVYDGSKLLPIHLGETGETGIQVFKAYRPLENGDRTFSTLEVPNWRSGDVRANYIVRHSNRTSSVKTQKHYPMTCTVYAQPNQEVFPKICR